MKEYKVLKRGTFQKEDLLIDEMHRFAKEGWRVITVLGDKIGNIRRVIMERDKNRMY